MIEAVPDTVGEKLSKTAAGMVAAPIVAVMAAAAWPFWLAAGGKKVWDWNKDRRLLKDFDASNRGLDEQAKKRAEEKSKNPRNP